MTAMNGAYRNDVAAFLEAYDASSDDLTGLMFGALKGEHSEGKRAIVARLLQDGADAAAVRDGYGALHVLLDMDYERDWDAEAELIAALIDGGADVNLRYREKLPLDLLVGVYDDDDKKAAAYDAFFASPELDLSVPYQTSNPERSLLQFLQGMKLEMFPALEPRLRAYEGRQ